MNKYALAQFIVRIARTSDIDTLDFVLANIDPTKTLDVKPRIDWENGIYQNSRFLILSLDWQGVLEEDARGSGLSKFRKAKVKSIDEAVKKINDWIRKNS